MIYDFQASGNYFKLDFDIQLEKDQQVYCFIGENGVGKTKLLQTMAKTIFNQHDIYQKISTNEEINSTEKIRISSSKTRIKKDLKVVSINITKNYNIPIIFISAKNRGYISGINDSKMVKLPPSKPQQLANELIFTFNSIYDREISLSSVTDWLLQRVMVNRNIKGVEKFYQEAIFVLECLSKLAPEMQWLKQDHNTLIDNFSYEEGKLLISGIPIEGLSTGYASILRIVQEIVAGLSAWDNNVDLDSADGIVFIDEIDLHLHPIWQYKIIDLLKEFFPKVTFYITTHSPLVLFNLKNGEGYKLVKDEKNLVTAQKIEQNNMQFIGDIIKQFFEVDGVSIRKTNKADMLQARKNLLDLIQENQDE